MPTVNFIHHITGVFEQFRKDARLNASHISIYMALFQTWNLYRFKQRFFVHRDEVMSLSKVGSRNTYHRCIRDLDNWKYIRYLPTHNPMKSSEVIMLNFDTSTGLAVDRYGTSGEQALGSYKNIKKTKENYLKQSGAPQKKDVFDFFKKKKWPYVEAQKFFLHYSSTHWKLGSHQIIKNWRPLAKKWMLRHETGPANGTEILRKDHLSTPKDQNYAEPL
ncbi:hypothetical protein [Maribacter sp. 2307ULW6-5]|uniref:hypothetical protein n=1 Tax=Maribacter sp. 2307ULW6-5 TaxID=3386275 RepID=UPI0039BD207F